MQVHRTLLKRRRSSECVQGNLPPHTITWLNCAVISYNVLLYGKIIVIVSPSSFQEQYWRYRFTGSSVTFVPTARSRRSPPTPLNDRCRPLMPATATASAAESYAPHGVLLREAAFLEGAGGCGAPLDEFSSDGGLYGEVMGGPGITEGRITESFVLSMSTPDCASTRTNLLKKPDIEL